MFGESESESPRVGSPWDSLLSSGTSTPSSLSGIDDTELPKVYKLSLPKLVPEAEEGNVEYKLQLIEPTPERFLRLVTQLKWRLLEGGGQAYYELGVADSGQLVGLTRKNLDKSLETLEAMAGEIGASVVVVKEIEVPGKLFDVGNANGHIMQPKGKGMNNGRNYTHSKHKGSGFGKSYRSRPSDWGAVEIIRNTSGTFTSGETSDSIGAIDGEQLKEDGICLTVRVSPHPKFSELSKTPPDRTPSPSSPADDDLFPFDTDLHLFATTVSIAEPPSPIPVRKLSKEVRLGNSSVIPKHLNGNGRSQAFQTPVMLESTIIDPDFEAAQVQKDLSVLHAPLADFSSTTRKGLGIQLPSTVASVPISVTTGLGLGLEPEPEPRLIVEALVVRKLSADEAFLDFGAFTLAD